jgi:hypothetical protein
MGTNMYPSSALLGQNKDESIASLPIDELIEKADGFAGVFPGMFYMNYICCIEQFYLSLLVPRHNFMLTLLILFGFIYFLFRAQI